MTSLIVTGTDKDKVVLVSKSGSAGILHQGAYLTIEDHDGQQKFVLRVEDTSQENPYRPSSLLVDMDLSPLQQDQKCQNIVRASRMMEFPERQDGMSSFIKPQMIARRSNQEEIDQTFGNSDGVPVFPATVFSRSVQHLYSEEGKFMQAKLPNDVFFHQMLIAGRTGSGKTVAMKYLAQYFLEELNGAVLAINVKEEDMLTMDKPSNTKSDLVKKEWLDLGLEPHGIETFRVYYPGHQQPKYSDNVNTKNALKITLHAKNIEPETLTGLIQNISDLGADQLPAIFRYWKEMNKEQDPKLSHFIAYFNDPAKQREYDTMNSRKDVGNIKLFSGTYHNVLNALERATEFFDVEDAKELRADDILQHGKMSVIDVTSGEGFGFAAVLLRDLLKKIYEAKSNRDSDVPILVIIDEVHEFYGSARSREALQVLDSICRKGRSLEIGVIFASQNPEDMPKGITSVVNSKIFFKSDTSSMKGFGINVTGLDSEALKAGYGVAQVYGLTPLKFVKFPLSLAGVYNG